MGLGWLVQLDFGLTRCQEFEACSRAEVRFAGVLFVEMRCCREAPTEQRLSCTVGRNCWCPGDTTKPRAPHDWLTHILKTKMLNLLSSCLCKDNRSTPRQPPPYFRQACSDSGERVKPDFVNDQIFGWIKSLLAFPCWKTLSSTGICWQGSGERHCFSHAHLFSQENESTRYWLFIIPPSNKLSAVQAAGGNSSTLLCVARHTSGATDNERANQTLCPKTPSQNYSAQRMLLNNKYICRN